MTRARFALPLLVFLVACGGKEEGGNNSQDAGGAMQEQAPGNLYQDQQNQIVPLTTPTRPGPSPSPVASIPADYQGRWGQVANDCVPGRSDAKGLMIVSADGLGFYESRASVGKIAATTPGTLNLTLKFTGEGQEWQRQETLTLLDAGKTLVRDEQHPAMSIRYQRCPAGKETNQ